MSYQQREYRFVRNHLIRDEAKKLCAAQAKNKLSDQIFVNKESKAPQLLKFHPYRPHLAVIHKNSWRCVVCREGVGESVTKSTCQTGV